MAEKKHPEKEKFVPELEKSITEISVAKRRSFEPFIKIFFSTGENVTKLDLGTLVGVFEVTERSEDSAYIVNFLASVAKKEYFHNPRRGAVESFEAALQKVNLALAELVKHGNIAWLGELHGALGVFEKNNMHFSVTGEARILLLRNENISDISEGLASEESHIHPIKTFVEVSSGRLSKDDKLLFATPDVFSLFPLETLRKNAVRMGKERFTQFLKTALINELDIAGALLIDIEEKPKNGSLSVKERARKSAPKASAVSETPSVLNVFSGKTFEEPEKISVPEGENFLEEEKSPSEYVDSKTGHIYVQGEISGETPHHPFLEHLSIWLQELSSSFHGFLLSQQRIFRKARKKSSLVRIAVTDSIQEGITQTKSSLKKKYEDEKKKREEKKKEEKEREESLVSLPIETPKESPLEEKVFEKPLPQPEAQREPESALAAFYRKGEASASPAIHKKPEEKDIKASSLSSLSGISKNLSPLAEQAKTFFQNGLRGALEVVSKSSALAVSFAQKGKEGFDTLTPVMKRNTLIAFALGILVIGGGIYFLLSHSNPKANQEAVETLPTQNGETGKGEPILRSLASVPGTVVDSLTLNEEAFAITQSAVIDIQSGKEYPVPLSGGSVRFGVPMEDLGLVFLASDQGEIFSWSPISKNFSKNTLTLPAGTNISGIGTYLTYLYVLDQPNNQIYRFPRAEGGFGEGSPWLKESATFAPEARMAVNEKVFLSGKDSPVSAFFRGRKEKDFSAPGESSTFQDLSVSTESGKVIALDTTHKRVLIWNQDGDLLGEYTSDKLESANTVSFVEKTNEIIFSDKNSLFSLKIQ